MLVPAALALALSFPLPSPDEVRAAPTFAPGERLVGTHYFYWYREPGEHLGALGLHFPRGLEVSYESVAWHLKEMRDVRAAGIDFVLPVYWGAPGSYEKPDLAFSVKGLPPLVAALDEMARSGETPPRVGLFYDTTTLLASVRGVESSEGRADLRAESGRDRFYGTIRDFFCQVPPRHWAQIGGKPVVVLYSASFSAGYDQRTFDDLADRFAKDFAGKRPFVIRDASWQGVKTDAETAWGAALSGPAIRDGVVQVGPGYDDSAVPGRTTPIRDREDGLFYEKAWRAALASGRDVVLVETWNEHHEATSIAETLEHGRRYIELTARYSALFKKRETLPDIIVLSYPEPRPRPDFSWGRDAKGERQVSFTAGLEPRGLRPVAHEDGPFFPAVAGDGSGAIRSAGAGPGRVTYVYFQVSDHFALDTSADATLEIEFRGTGPGSLAIQYDSRRRGEPLAGAYARAVSLDFRGEGGWRREIVPLREARFANRQNSGADFRVAIEGSDILIRSALVRR